MTTDVFAVSGKFARDARKAFFAEMSMRLEMMAEVLEIDSKLSDFDEIIEIVKILKIQANSFYCDKILDERTAQKMQEVKF